MEDVREFGLQFKKQLRRRKPVRQWLREFITVGENAENEQAAYFYWFEHLSEEQKRESILHYKRTHPKPRDQIESHHYAGWEWGTFTPQQKWDALAAIGLPTESPAESPPPGLELPESFAWPPPEATLQSEPNRVGPVSHNYDHRVIHQTIFNPVVGMNKQDLRIEPPYFG
jgi:hypothetical protein